MLTWNNQHVSQIAVVLTPRAVLEHIRENPNLWWKIVTPHNPHWFCCYSSGRWIFSTPNEDRKSLTRVAAYVMLERLQAKSFELRLEGALAQPIERPGPALMLLLVVVGALVSAFWLGRALGWWG